MPHRHRGLSWGHYWARELLKLGHSVKLMPAQYVKAYVKGNKNDGNDAEAICEAVSRPGMRFVAINTEPQQEIQMLHRIRSRVVAERTALLNQIRGLLGEYGIVFGQGPSQVRRGIAALLTGEDPRLSAMARELVLGFQAELRELGERIGHYDARVKATCAGDARSVKVAALPGSARSPPPHWWPPSMTASSSKTAGRWRPTWG